MSYPATPIGRFPPVLLYRRTAWLIALLAVLCAAFVSRLTALSYVRSEAAVRHTLALRAAIGDALSLLKDAETGQRGYLLTGDPALLAPHARAERELALQLERLHALTSGDAAQQRSAEEVRRLATAKLDVIARTIALRRGGHPEQALAIVREGRGHQLMDALRVETDRMAARETAQLAAYERDAEISQERVWVASGAALAVALAIVVGGLLSEHRNAIAAARARQQLHDSERAFRTLADNASDLVRILEPDRSLSYVSPSSQALVGYSSEEMLALRDYSWLPEEERAAAGELAARVRSTGVPSTNVHRIHCKDGSTRWFETTVNLALDQSGKPGRLHLSSRDITSRRLAEDALQRQTARLESILTSMGDGVLVLDHERRVVVVNPAAKEHVRHEPGEVISAAKWAQEYRALQADGVTPFAAEQGPLTRALKGEACDHVEMVMEDRAGRVRIFSITSRPLLDDSEGVGCVGVYHDITEQRLAERALGESERRWRVLSEASFEGIAVSRNGVILDSNATFASWLGKTPSDLVGMVGLEAFAPEDRELVAKQSTQSGSVYEARMVHADGTLFPVEVRGRAAVLNGETVRVAVVRDVTEKKRREAELREQAELLRSLSLRDELSGLYNRRGFLELSRQQLRHAARGGRMACLFFADLNGMKAINDRLGHEVGDRALAVTGRLLSTVFRDSDIVARLGGDEFAVFAPECDGSGMTALSERVQVEVQSFNALGVEPFKLSISLGGALYDPARPVELEALIEAADAKMYEEKRVRPRAGIRFDADTVRLPPPDVAS